MTDKTPEQDVAFGFRRVGEGEKQGLVNEVFSKVAERYDQMNDLMSGGLHRLWKDDFVAQLNPPRWPARFNMLDVAGGTGDVAFRIARAGGPMSASRLPTFRPKWWVRAASGRRPMAFSDAVRFQCRQCRGSGVSRQELRRLYDRLRHSQCHPYRPRRWPRPTAC